MAWSRRGALMATVGGAATLAGLTGCASVVRRPAQERPNILWMVSEDNNPNLGAYGDTLAHTPNLDALASRGVLYRNAFSNGPVCATSRFGILTGVYAESCSPANHMRANAHLPAEIKTYPEYLRESGYYCTNNSKTDYNCDVDPARIWNDSSVTAQWRNRPAGAPFMAVYNDFTTHESQIFFKTEGRVKPEDVRVPAYLPDTTEVRIDIASYYNRIELMDQHCGERLATLEQEGVAEDTIVFYYSDNGGVMPRSKHYGYDEGFRTCLIIYVPPKWQHLAPARPGSEVTEPVSFIDLAPTLLSLIGQPKPAYMPGRALLGPFAGAPEQLAFGMRDRMDERYDFNRTACDGRHRYIRNYLPDQPWGVPEVFAWSLKSYQSWEREHMARRLNPAQDRFFQSKPYEEFYDLHIDPDEIHNLIDDPDRERQIEEMRAALDRHMIEINDNGFIPEGAQGEGYFPSKDRSVYPLERLMSLAEKAAQGHAADIDAFRIELDDPNPLIRYWAVIGLRIVKQAALPAKADLIRLSAADPSPHVQIVAAQTIVGLGEADAGVSKLSAILDSQASKPLRLQAINALTLVGEPARAALPAIRRASTSYDDIGNAGRYLVAVLEGTYKPGSLRYLLPGGSTFPTAPLPPPPL